MNMRLWGLRNVWLVAALGLAACSPHIDRGAVPTSSATTATSTSIVTTSTTSTSATAATVNSAFPPSGPVEPGTYHIASSAWSVADLTMTVPEGWETQYGSPGAIKRDGQVGEIAFYFVVVDAIYSDPCVGSGGGADELTRVGPSVDDLAAALIAQPSTAASGPVDTTLGGLPAKRIDLTNPDDFDGSACNIPGELQIWYSAPADKYFVLLADGTASVYILDVNGERQVFLTQYRDGATAEDLKELQTIIDSINIEA